MACKIEYLNERDVEGVVRRPAPMWSGQTVSGYGGKISTDWMICVGGRWYRVYVMIWSNSGSAYILRKKQKVLLGSFQPANWGEEWYEAYRERQGWPTAHSLRQQGRTPSFNRRPRTGAARRR